MPDGIADALARPRSKASRFFAGALRGLRRRATLILSAVPRRLGPPHIRILIGHRACAAYDQRVVFEQRRIEETVAARTAKIMQARDVLQHMAMSDTLTGLPNRRAILQALEEAVGAALSSGRPLSVLLCDIDHFKTINDRLGHPSGDEALSAFGERFGAAAMPGEVVGRYGGEEFLVILRGQALSDAAARAGEIVSGVIGTSVVLGTEPHRLTLSGGLAALRRTDDATTLIARADTALYLAKANGRDRIELERDETAALRECELERDLRSALAKGEFALLFQPVTDVVRGVITLCEALLRWDSPTRGRVAPEDFIAVAERSNLMPAIDAWVLRAACREAATWPCTVRVSVNLSSTHLLGPGLVEMIGDILSETGLTPGRLELEITETAIILDVTHAAIVLMRLRELGVSIALDDFGTGYSSLSFLRALPFDRIKIDCAFVRDLGTAPESTTIIANLINLCSSMGASITAEGVETRRQVELLHNLGCRELQGFGVCRPLPADGIRHRIAALARVRSGSQRASPQS